jgi:hypothetical protein
MEHAAAKQGTEMMRLQAYKGIPTEQEKSQVGQVSDWN